MLCKLESPRSRRGHQAALWEARGGRDPDHAPCWPLTTPMLMHQLGGRKPGRNGRVRNLRN